jgi:hydrogenase-4 component E
MDLTPIDLLSATAAGLAVWMCGVTRIRSKLCGLALQTGALGLIAALFAAEGHGFQYYLLAGGVIVIRALGIPGFLDWTSHRIGAIRDPGVVLNPALGMLAGCFALAAGHFLGGRIAGPAVLQPGAAGMALALLLIGMLQMITHRLAVSQIIGFLVMENGIFLYALTQTRGMPMMIEMGVMLDALVGVMLAGLFVFRLNRSFEHIDVTQLRGLRD